MALTIVPILENLPPNTCKGVTIMGAKAADLRASGKIHPVMLIRYDWEITYIPIPFPVNAIKMHTKINFK